MKKIPVLEIIMLPRFFSGWERVIRRTTALQADHFPMIKKLNNADSYDQEEDRQSTVLDYKKTVEWGRGDCNNLNFNRWDRFLQVDRSATWAINIQAVAS